MAVSVKGMPYPFPELEIRRPCKVVGGSDLAAGAVVRLVTGTYTSTAATEVASDNITLNDFFGDQVVAITKANYPEDPEDDGPVASRIRVAPFAIGVLEAATADNSVGYVTFRGYIPSLALVTVNGEVYSQGSLVFLDSSASFALKVTSVSADILAIGDIIVGRLAAGATASGTSNNWPVMWNGVDVIPQTLAPI